MAMVMIRCPQTGGRTFTGIETDEITFERLPDATARAVFALRQRTRMAQGGCPARRLGGEVGQDLT
jgi:hypothetical protein